VSGKLPDGATLDTAVTPADFAEARSLFEEYARALGVDLCFQGFTRELQTLEEMYAPPGGGLLIAHVSGEAAGCAAFRPFGDEAVRVCEMKRLYVRAERRGLGLGRMLAVAIVDGARAAGYASMVLDTLGTMQTAQRLYRSLGFREIEPFYDNPLGEVAFLGLDLVPRSDESVRQVHE
jgi:ribosomal protein S18 acetylase RimI-like enzyme